MNSEESLIVISIISHNFLFINIYMYCNYEVDFASSLCCIFYCYSILQGERFYGIIVFLWQILRVLFFASLSILWECGSLGATAKNCLI